MATKTYLQLVNKVLQSLRETAVQSVGASDYSLLVGEYVNQAKEKVERAWKWRTLRVQYSFTTVAGTRNYSLIAGGPTQPGNPPRFPDSRAYLLRDRRNRPLVFDTTIATQSYQLKEYTYVDGVYNDIPGAGQTFTNIPDGFYYTAGDTPSITLTQNTFDNRQITLVMVVPQDEFTIGSEVLLVPWRPVVDLAYALANDERGEELGNDGQLLFNKANDSMSQAISQDIESQDFEMIPD